MPLLFSLAASAGSATDQSVPILVGAMKDVMWEGKLAGIIDIDTLSDKEHLFGLGPEEFLKGEIIIVDGKCYKSEISKDGKIKVSRTTKVKAPFFGYARVRKWKKETLPDSVTDLKDLESYLLRKSGTNPSPFLFKIETTVETLKLHVVNLPPGTAVKSPADAHMGQREFEMKDKDFVLIGFFSTAHQAVFTHHDTFLHIHAIAKNKELMGHLDEIRFKPGKAWISTPLE